MSVGPIHNQEPIQTSLNTQHWPVFVKIHCIPVDHSDGAILCACVSWQQSISWQVNGGYRVSWVSTEQSLLVVLGLSVCLVYTDGLTFTFSPGNAYENVDFRPFVVDDGEEYEIHVIWKLLPCHWVLCRGFMNTDVHLVLAQYDSDKHV
jgi:hypothetical protein